MNPPQCWQLPLSNLVLLIFAHGPGKLSDPSGPSVRMLESETSTTITSAADDYQLHWLVLDPDGKRRFPVCTVET
jgi:hypothetical protein